MALCDAKRVIIRASHVTTPNAGSLQLSYDLIVSQNADLRQ